MLKVFLVEDEVVVRSGIKNSIDWKSEGFEFVGEAADGELALPLIKKSKPDILITDIRMPFMNGIELSETVHKLFPNMKIIILSGYGEFQYAQKAIQIGIGEYLLKPISSAKLLDSIRKVADQIEKEQQERLLLVQYAEEMQENLEHRKYQFFSRLIAEHVPVSQALGEGAELGMDLSAACYQILLFKVREKEDENRYCEHEVATVESIQKSVADWENVYFYQRGVEGLAFLFLADETEKLDALSKDFCSHLIADVSAQSGMEYFGGLGKPIFRLGELRDSYNDANKGYAARFVRPWNQIMGLTEGTNQNQETESKMESRNLVSMENSRELIEKFLRTGTVEEVDSFLEGYLDNMNVDNLKSLMFRQYVAMDIYFSVVGFEEKLGIPEKLLTKNQIDINQLSGYIGTLEDTWNYVGEILKNSITKRDEQAGRKYSDLIGTACQYIREHYQDEDISLNTVSSHVNMSPSYFSSVFGREVGQTFIEYLTNIRLEKAKELLMCSSLKNSEIGYEVGYKDSHYFSYIFKKVQGCSPKEYRTRGKETE